jgi:glycosyltransferase involved in cell wall biosynthesis
MSSPSLSVIMPVLRGEFIAEAIASTKRSGIDLELIVVDDGSEDAAELASGLADTIIYIRQSNAGPAAARNRGLSTARGKFIGFLDADDIWTATHPSSALAYLNQHADVDLVLGRVQLFTSSSDDQKFSPTGKPFHTYQLGAAVIRREVIDRVGMFDPNMRYGEDVDWFLRLRENHITIAMLPEVALYYRLHRGNQPHVYKHSRTGLLNAFHQSLVRRRGAPIHPNQNPARPLVSVISPVFNGEAFIAEAIASVVAQDYRPLEIIVVDDGSTDRTREIVRGIPEVTLIECPHRGAGSARNAGVRAAKGELLAFIDADDLWTPNKLTTQIEAVSADSNLEAVFSHVTEFRGEDIANQSEPMAAPMLGTMLIKRASFERIGWFADEPTAVEGVDWYLRASEQSLRSRVLPDVLYRRRIHSANRSIVNRDPSAYLRAIKSSLDRRRAAENLPRHADRG